MLPVFPTARVIERLREKVPALRIVEGAAGLIAAEKQKPERLPAAFVIAQEKADPPKGYSGGVMAQNVNVTVVVVLFVSHAAKANTGAAAQGELDELHGLVRGALTNWKPMPAGSATALHFLATDNEAFAAGSQQGQAAYGMNYTMQQGANP